MMFKCLRCGYAWNPRSGNPTRCPNCKSTRWNYQHVEHTCMRCNFKWNQRGDSAPRYCPSCHSSMWNSEKIVFTCPKCGRSRTLRSNSRSGLCPICDEYGKLKQKTTNEPARMKLTRPVTIWSDGDGRIMMYSTDGSGTASVLENGHLVGSTNIDYWFRSHNYTPEKAIKNCNDPVIHAHLTQLVQIIYSEMAGCMSRVERVSALRHIDETEAKIITLYESGKSPIAIAMMLPIEYSKVMDVLKSIPPMSAPSKLEKCDESKSDSGSRTDTNAQKV